MELCFRPEKKTYRIISLAGIRYVQSIYQIKQEDFITKLLINGMFTIPGVGVGSYE